MMGFVCYEDKFDFYLWVIIFYSVFQEVFFKCVVQLNICVKCCLVQVGFIELQCIVLKVRLVLIDYFLNVF